MGLWILSPSSFIHSSLLRYRGHKNTDYQAECCFSEYDSHVFSTSEDGCVYIWDLLEVSSSSSSLLLFFFTQFFHPFSSSFSSSSPILSRKAKLQSRLDCQGGVTSSLSYALCTPLNRIPVLACATAAGHVCLWSTNGWGGEVDDLAEKERASFVGTPYMETRTRMPLFKS